MGLINACIDINTQMPLYPVMANNNTYGIQLFNASEYVAATAAIPACLNLTTTCRGMVDRFDPQGWGNNSEVTQACSRAYGYCFKNVALEDGLGNLLTADVRARCIPWAIATYQAPYDLER